MILVDSSTVNLPDSEAEKYEGRGGSHGFGKAALKLQTELDLKSGRREHVEVTSGCDSDVACAAQSRPIAEGTLRITDLGYFAAEVFAYFAAIKCFYLSRMQRTMRVRADYKRRNRGTPPERALAACEWTMLVTNLKLKQLSVNEAAVLYRSRCQIELLFKRWKSIGEAIPGSDRSDTVEMVRFVAKLCGVLIQHWIGVVYGQKLSRRSPKDP